MAQLDHILEAVLTSIARARADSDRFSAKLSRDYLTGGEPLLKEFPVPRATIDSARIELKFAIKSAVRAVRFDEAAVGVAASAIVTKAMLALAEGFRGQLAASPPDTQDPWAKLAAAASSSNRAAMTAATAAVARFLVLGLSEYVDESGNLTDRKKLLVDLGETLDEALFNRPELVAGATVSRAVKGQAEAVLGAIVDRLPSLVSADLNVLVDTESLTAVRPEAISTLSLQLSIQDYRWHPEPQADGPLDHAAPATPVDFAEGDEPAVPAAKYRLVGQ
jgi:hypothetical protein